MKNIFALLSLSFSSIAFAGSIWISGPRVSNQDFEIFVRQQPEARTYAQFLASKIPDGEIPSANLEWAQNILEQQTIPADFEHDLKEIEERGMVNKSQRAFLVGFLQKLKEKNLNGNKSYLQKWICKWSVFPGETNSAEICIVPSQNMSFLKEKWPQANILMLEDQALSLKEDLKISVLEDEVYNWKLLSNSSRMIFFRGTLRDLRNQDFRFEDLVHGSCDSFSHNLDDMELVSNASVYFGDVCAKSLKQPETSQSLHWLEENRSWVIPAGIAVLGALAYQYKEKKLVIEKPSFR